MHLALKLTASITALFLTSTTASAQDDDLAASFFNALGGDADVDTVGANSPEARPLREVPAEIIGARFFKERNGREPFIAANRGLEAFAGSCSQNGGHVLAQDSERSRMFVARVAGHLTRPTGYKHQWRAVGAICDNQAGAPIAGYLAVLQDNSAVLEQGDVGSRLMGGLFGMRTPTAIYLVHPGRLPTQADVEVQHEVAADNAQYRDDQIRLAREHLAQFRQNLAIGDETTCGTVIEVRGPMAEIAVPAFERAPNGAPTFWSRIEHLAPAGTAICTYGL